jgi:hypothetical protein
LQKLVGPEFPLEAGIAVAGRGDHHGTNGKIDTRRETCGGDDDLELASFSERFDPICPCGVGESTVVKSHAVLKKFGEVASEQILVFRCHAQWAIHWKRGGDLSRHFFCIAAAGSEKQEWGKPRQNSSCGYAGPETMNRIRHTREILHWELI